MAHPHDSTALELPLPARRHQTLGLVILRRMAGHGLHDARATMLALDAGGTDFRKLLVLARALIVDLARTSQRRILLAPCCAAGMTRDEGLLMALIGGGGLDWLDWILIALIPVLGVVLAGATARFTVLSPVRGML